MTVISVSLTPNDRWLLQLKQSCFHSLHFTLCHTMFNFISLLFLFAKNELTYWELHNSRTFLTFSQNTVFQRIFKTLAAYKTPAAFFLIAIPDHFCSFDPFRYYFRIHLFKEINSFISGAGFRTFLIGFIFLFFFSNDFLLFFFFFILPFPLAVVVLVVAVFIVDGQVFLILALSLSLFGRSIKLTDFAAHPSSTFSHLLWILHSLVRKQEKR